MFVLYFPVISLAQSPLRFVDSTFMVPFKALPKKVQKLIVADIQKKLNDKTVSKSFDIKDTISEKSYSHGAESIRHYKIHVIVLDTLEKGNNYLIKIWEWPKLDYETSTDSYDRYSDLDITPENKSDFEKPNMASAGKLSFICLDPSHKPHHAATSLRAMRELQIKYHCSKIGPLIMD